VRASEHVWVKGFAFLTAIIMGSGMVLHAGNLNSTATTDSDCEYQAINQFLCSLKFFLQVSILLKSSARIFQDLSESLRVNYVLGGHKNNGNSELRLWLI